MEEFVPKFGSAINEAGPPPPPPPPPKQGPKAFKNHAEWKAEMTRLTASLTQIAAQIAQMPPPPPPTPGEKEQAAANQIKPGSSPIPPPIPPPPA